MTPLRSRPRSARFVPAIESLEERVVPAITTRYKPGDPTTVGIFGDPGKADLIRILDDGSTDPDAIKVYEVAQSKPQYYVHLDFSGSIYYLWEGTLTGDVKLCATLPGTIKNLWVFTYGKGNDRVEYWPKIGIGVDHVNYTTDRAVFVDLSKGKGTETFVGLLEGVTVQPGAHLSLNVRGGPGDDIINVGLAGAHVAHDAGLTVGVMGGGGDTGVTIEDPGFVRGWFGLTVDPGGQIYLPLVGGAKDNDIRVYLENVRLDGQLSVPEWGHAGDDNLWATLNLDPESKGALSAMLDGGPGNNQLTLDVFPTTFTPAYIGLFAGPGGNSIAYTNTTPTTTSPGLTVLPT
jgi:hypothetical protein